MLALLSLILVLLAGPLAAVPADAHPGKRQGLTFQDTRPLTPNWGQAKAGLPLVRVCNLDDRPAPNVVAALTGFGLRHADSTAAGDDEVWKDPEKVTDAEDAPDLTRVASGDCVPLRVEAKGAKPKPGTYTGILVITSGGGGGARRKVVLTVGKPKAKTPEVAAGPPRILTKPLGDFGVGGVNFFPSLLNPTDTAVFNAGWLVLFICLPFLLLPVARSEKKDFARSGNRASVRSPNKASTRPPNKAWLVGAAVVALALLLSGAAGALDPDDEFFEGPGESAVRMSTPLVDGAAAKGAVGSLVGKDGAVAMAVVKPDDADAKRLELDVEEIPRAGAYEGKIDLLPDAEGGDATVTANVRDYWPYALVVIALGVGLGAWLSWYFTVKRGRSLVHIKLTTLLERVDDVSPPPPYSDYAVEERMGARAAAIDKLLESNDPEDTKKAGDEVAAAQSYFESVTEMWDQLPKVEEAIELTAAEVTRGKFNVAGDDVPAVFRARDLLRTPFDSDAADTDSALLTARRKAVDDALALLLELCRSLPRAARIRDAADQVSPAPADRIAALRKAVAELVAAGSADDARKSMGTVVGEGSIILEGAKRAEQPEAQALLMAERASVPREAFRLGLAAGPPSVPPPEPVLPGPTPRPSAAQLRRRFELTDLQMTTITGVLAVLSGLLALYFTSSTWGAPGDYLKAFLWGSVLSEGIKYVTSLVTRSGPAAG